MDNSELISTEPFPDMLPPKKKEKERKKLDNDSACGLAFENLTNALSENPGLITPS